MLHRLEGDLNSGARRGLSCNKDGLFLGPDCPLVTCENVDGVRSYRARPIEQINRVLSAGYGARIDLSARKGALDTIVGLLSKGELGMAQITALQMRLPALPNKSAVQRLRKADRLLRFNPNHKPSAPGRGRFTSGSPSESEQAEQKSSSATPSRVPATTSARGSRRYPVHSVDDLPPVSVHPSPVSLAQQKAVSLATSLALVGAPSELASWKALETAMGMGSITNPGPGRLLYEWRTGTGPAERILGPSTTFAQQFATARSTQAAVTQALGFWRNRSGGLAGLDGRYSLTRYDVSFGPGAVMQDTVAPNAAAHVIGSFELAAIVDGDTIHWQAFNEMDVHSFAAGHWMDKFNIPLSVPDIDRPLAFGTTCQIIRWDTNLYGRYISR